MVYILPTPKAEYELSLIRFSCILYNCHPLILTFDLDPGNLRGCPAIQPFMLSEVAIDDATSRQIEPKGFKKIEDISCLIIWVKRIML